MPSNQEYPLIQVFKLADGNSIIVEKYHFVIVGDDPQERASAIEAAGGFYGWMRENFLKLAASVGM